MAGKKIPLKDKALVKKRIAEGKSLREAIKGTAIKSPATAKKLAEDNANSIEQIRTNYLKLIEGFKASEIDRAKLWARMTKATKLFGKDSVEHPDWANREKALRYIDSLWGISTEEKAVQKTQVNIFNRLKEEDKEFIEGEEV